MRVPGPPNDSSACLLRKSGADPEYQKEGKRVGLLMRCGGMVDESTGLLMYSYFTRIIIAQ